jgi:hypothetical protein
VFGALAGRCDNPPRRVLLASRIVPWGAASWRAPDASERLPVMGNRSVNSVTPRGRDGSGARRPPVPGPEGHVEGERLASRPKFTEA